MPQLSDTSLQDTPDADGVPSELHQLWQRRSASQTDTDLSVRAAIPQWTRTIKVMIQADNSRRARLERLTLALVHGVVIDVDAEPRAVRLDNTVLVAQRLDLCKERLKHYADIDALEELSEAPPLLQPLHVVVRPGKKDRLVIDLSRNLNDELQCDSFSLPVFEQAVLASSPCCFYGKMDLSDCFLSFDVHPDSRRFLAFELDGKFYRWKRLPFGLKVSPFWCNEFLSVVDFAIKARGVRHLRYCDDYLFLGDSREDILHAFRVAREVLASHGLRVNEAKTEGPLQRIVFLGLGLDSVAQESFVPQDKRTECIGLLKRSHKILSNGECLNRQGVQSLVGKLSFVSAVLPGARPFFRHLIAASAHLPHRRSIVRSSPGLLEDLEMWTHILQAWKSGRSNWPRDEPEIEFFHDASKAKGVGGFGFFLAQLPPGVQLSLPHEFTHGHGFAGIFPPEVLAAHSIQWAELYAMAYCLALYGPYLRDRSVLLRSDNLADVYIVNKMKTRKDDLLVLLRAIYSTAAFYNIRLRVKHVRGENNDLADLLSRAEFHLHRTRVLVAGHPYTSIHYILSSSFLLPVHPQLPATIRSSC